MQGTQVWSLARQDPTSRTATKPVRRNYWAWTPRARALKQEKLLQWEARLPERESRPRALQLEKAHVQPWRPSADENK